MPQPKKAPASAGAAASETTGAAKTVEYRGLRLTLPATLDDADGRLFDAIAEIDDGSISGVRTAVIAVIGDDQYRQVRDKHSEDGVKFGGIVDAMTDLLKAILGEYGVELGNSSASDGS